MWHIYTKEYYSAIKNDNLTNFVGKWMKLVNIILSEVIQTKWYALTDKCILDQNLRIPTIQLTDHMKLNKKEGQSVDASIPLRRRNRIIMRGRGREGPGRERSWKEKSREAGPGIGRDRKEFQGARRMNRNKQQWGIGHGRHH